MKLNKLILESLSESALTDDKFIIFDLNNKSFINIVKKELYRSYKLVTVYRDISKIKTFFDSKQDAESYLNQEYIKDQVKLYSYYDIITLGEAKAIISGEKNPFELEFDIREYLKDVETINSNQIGDIPPTAEYARFNPTNKFIQGFYRTVFTSFNDGTHKCLLEFYGERNSWRLSSYNSSDLHKLKDVKDKFRKIVY